LLQGRGIFSSPTYNSERAQKTQDKKKLTVMRKEERGRRIEQDEQNQQRFWKYRGMYYQNSASLPWLLSQNESQQNQTFWILRSLE
jgi:hypothetical protein